METLDALRGNFVSALEPQFKIRCFEHRDCPTAVPVALYHDMEKKYRKELAYLKRRARSIGGSKNEGSNHNDQEEME